MKIYVWGTGRLTGKVIGKYLNPDEITAYVDNDERKTMWQGKKVIQPTMLKKANYDAIVVITLHSQEIYEQCKELGLCMDKVVFLYQNLRGCDLNTNYCLIEQIFGSEYTNIVKNRYHIIRRDEGKDAPHLQDACPVGGYFATDYVRMRCFELVVKEIKKRNVPGSVAEVGVFRGEFAQYISAAFPERNCYLCDSFDGFDTIEADSEMQKNNATKAFVEAYKDTSEQIVMKRMPYKDRVIIRKGFFPDTMIEVDEIFAFVSIDMDFENSIYEGLKYFYPRLSKGGYIFVHDYNSSLYGVEKAVDRYEKENELIISKVPLCDANGTLVITK